MKVTRDDLVVVGVYSPSQDEKGERKDTFQEDFTNLVKNSGTI